MAGVGVVGTGTTAQATHRPSPPAGGRDGGERGGGTAPGRPAAGCRGPSCRTSRGEARVAGAVIEDRRVSRRSLCLPCGNAPLGAKCPGLCLAGLRAGRVLRACLHGGLIPRVLSVWPVFPHPGRGGRGRTGTMLLAGRCRHGGGGEAVGAGGSPGARWRAGGSPGREKAGPRECAGRDPQKKSNSLSRRVCGRD